FLMLLGRALRWGVPWEQIEPLLPAAEAAARWVVEHGDRDGDGFVEYQRTSDRGLLNQGWKDSADSICFADGRPAHGPIALAEVQGYCYAALLAMADLEARRGDEEAARGWRERAERLRVRFHEAFWMPDQQFYALALDGDKRQVDAIASNAGHCLWTGIVPEEAAPAVADRLLSPEMFTGFGVRTLGTANVRYNPVSYHNGSVWPHDTAIGTAGLARYGFTDQAQRVSDGLLDAATAFDGRLPELFCGFDRAEQQVPVRYPTSCSPQAWAAAVPFELLRIALGMEPSSTGLDVGATPERVGSVAIDNLPFEQRSHRVRAVRRDRSGRRGARCAGGAAAPPRRPGDRAAEPLAGQPAPLHAERDRAAARGHRPHPGGRLARGCAHGDRAAPQGRGPRGRGRPAPRGRLSAGRVGARQPSWTGSSPRGVREAIWCSASRRCGKRKSKPLASSTPGCTQRLLSTSSVSVRMTRAPNSSSQRGSGSPTGTPKTSRIVAISSALVTGCGVATLTGPRIDGVAATWSTTRATSSTWTQLNIWPPSPIGPPKPIRTRLMIGLTAPPRGPSTIDIRSATVRTPSGAVSSSRSHARATSTEKPPPSSPVASSWGRSRASR